MKNTKRNHNITAAFNYELYEQISSLAAELEITRSELVYRLLRAVFERPISIESKKIVLNNHSIIEI